MVEVRSVKTIKGSERGNTLESLNRYTFYSVSFRT